MLLAVLVLVALAAPWIAPYRFDEMSLLNRLKPPSAQFWLGTDEFGRDVFSRTLMGGRLSLLMGFAATVLSLAIGVPLGLLAGYRRGVVDETIMRATDVLLSFPPIMLGCHAAFAVEADPRHRHRLRARHRASGSQRDPRSCQ
jgi:peptide/nickel transport system permease protein